MVIDFHSHIFPDKIAERAIKGLAEASNISPFGKATLSEIKKDMKKNGIDISVILPVATAIRQVESINRTAIDANGKDGIVYFGAIHPDCENTEEILDGIKAAGLKGIKIHPDYQGVYFDDARYIKILREAAKRDLLTVTHAGVDYAYPNDVHCTPDMVLNVFNELSGIIDNKLILAHMGGNNLADEVLEKLVGLPVYFDTSFVLERYTEKCEEIIKKHSAEKILFATDYPWEDGQKFIKILNSLNIPQEDKDKIFYKNAQNLLNI